MTEHIEDAITGALNAAVAIQALARPMAQSDHTEDAVAVRRLTDQIEATLRKAAA